MQADAAASLCLAQGAQAVVVAGDEERSLWNEYDRNVWGGAVEGVVAKVSVLPTEVADLLDQAGASLAAGRAALGVLYLRAGSAATAPDWLDKLRALAGRRGGSAVVVKASPTLENRIDVWGELPGSRSLMRAVKMRFDPNGILNPGGGPGGL